MDYEATRRTIKDMVSQFPNRKCKVYLLHGDLSSSQMTWLYTHPNVKSMINIAHGEGFGLPLFEAAREALPIVTIGWSGQQDFLVHDKKEYFQSVEYTLQPVQQEAIWPGVIEKDSMWAHADQGSYKMKLRDMRSNWDSHKTTAEELKTLLEENFSEEKLYSGFCDSILDVFPNEQEIDDMFAGLMNS
jgi:hypothetical protein